MKKTFCDCCGEEIGEKQAYTLISVMGASNNDSVEIDEIDNTYKSYDLCNSCGKRFNIMFKNWREFK